MDNNYFPLISVIIPSYKAANFISKAIDSALEQVGVQVQVIVVEDGTYDNTGEIISGYDCSIDHIVLEENHGACYARNLALEKAKADYVIFLDADDYFEGPLLRGLYESLENSGASVAFGPCRIEEKMKSRLFIPPASGDSISVIKRWITGNWGPGTCSILWRKSEIIRIGGWNTDYSKNQDGELIVRAMFNHCSASGSIQGTGVYVYHDGDRISEKHDKKAFESFEKLCEYISRMIRESNTLKEELEDALNFYKISVAGHAYNNKLFEVGDKWIDKWQPYPLTVKRIKSYGLKIIACNILARSLGVRYGLKTYFLMKTLTNFRLWFLRRML